MAASDGRFILKIGKGTLTSGAGSVNPSTPIPLLKAFSNSAPFSGLQCATGTAYSPAAGDKRKLYISFNDGTQTVVMTQGLDIESSPFAMVADTLQGKAPVDFVQVNSTTAAVTQANLESIFSTFANVAQLQNLIAGTSILYAKSSPSNGTRLPVYTGAPTTPLQGSIWYDSAAGKMSYYDGTSVQNLGTSGGSVSAVTAGSGLSGGTITSSGTISMPAVGTAGTYAKVTTDAQGRVSAGSALLATDIPNIDATKITTGVFSAAQIPAGTDTSKLPLAGGTMTGSINMGGQDVTSTGYVTMNPGKYFGLGTYTDTAESSLVSATLTPGGATYKGVTWFNTTTNAIKYWDGASVVALASGPSLLNTANIFVGNASNVATSVSMSGDATIAASGALTLKNTGTAGTYTKVTTDAQGRVTAGTNISASDVSTALAYMPLNKAGDTLSGALAMGGNNITGVGNIWMNSGKTFLLGSYDNTTEGTLTTGLTNTAADIGKTWYNTASNQIKYWNGTAATALGVSGSGLTNLNGLTVSTQSFSDGTAGTAPTFVSSGSTHTLNIPFASTASVSAGLLSNTDYVQMIRKDGTTAFTADQSIGAHKLTNLSDPVAAQDAASKNYSDAHTAGKNVATSVATTLTGAAGNGFVLTWDQTGNQWTAAPSSGGSVTAVNLTLPSIFNVSGGPITSAGTLVGSLATQPANSIFAGPSSGGAVAPTFRSLASTDLPTIPVAKGGIGSTSLTPNGILMADGTGSAVSSPVCGAGQGYVSNGTSFSCTSLPSGAVTFMNGGNSFAANSTIGNNDNFSLGFKTSGATQMTINNAGNVGIGTTSPALKLDIAGDVNVSGMYFMQGAPLLIQNNTNSNLSIGNAAANMNSASGLNNVALGSNALNALTSGGGNTALGAYALRYATSSGSNTGVGVSALGSTTTGSTNTAVGQNALVSNTIGNANVAVGQAALNNNVGNNNVAIGTSGLAAVTTGSNNTAIGFQVGNSLTTGSNNILIGSGINATAPNINNTLNIGNLIYGDMTGGNVGIGTSAPTVPLQVMGPGLTTPVAMIQNSGTSSSNFALEVDSTSNNQAAASLAVVNTNGGTVLKVGASGTPLRQIWKFTTGTANTCSATTVSAGTAFSCSYTLASLPTNTTTAFFNCNVAGTLTASGTGVWSAGTLYVNAIVAAGGTVSTTLANFTCMGNAF
jgi:hypothetical protein